MEQIVAVSSTVVFVALSIFLYWRYVVRPHHAGRKKHVRRALVFLFVLAPVEGLVLYQVGEKNWMEWGRFCLPYILFLWGAFLAVLIHWSNLADSRRADKRLHKAARAAGEDVPKRWPLLRVATTPFLILFLMSVGTGIAGHRDLSEFFDYAGVWSFVTCFTAFLCILFFKTVVLLSCTGKPIPIAAVLAVAGAPWLLGILGNYVGMIQATTAMESCRWEIWPIALAKGVSVSMASKIIGIFLTGALLTGVGLALSRAFILRAGKTKRAPWPIPLVCAASTFPMVALGAYGVAAGEMIILPALFAAVAAILVALRTTKLSTTVEQGDKDVRTKMAGLASACLGFVALAGFAANTKTCLLLGALESAAPDARRHIVSAADERVFPLQLIFDLSLVAALIPIVVVAKILYGSLDLNRKQFKNALMAAIVCVGLIGLDNALLFSQATFIHRYSVRPWQKATGFTPVLFKDTHRLEDGYFSDNRYYEVPHAALTEGKILSWMAGSMSYENLMYKSDRARVARHLRKMLINLRGIKDRQPLYQYYLFDDVNRPSFVPHSWTWLLKYGAEKELATPEDDRKKPYVLTLGLAVDDRVSTSTFRGMVDAAGMAGARAIGITGRETGPTDSAIERLYGWSDLFFSAFDKPLLAGTKIRLATSLRVPFRRPDGPDPYLTSVIMLHGRVGRDPVVSIEPMEVSRQVGVPFTVDLKADRLNSPSIPYRNAERIVLLQFSSRATIESIIDAARRLLIMGYQPVLVPGALPTLPRPRSSAIAEHRG